MVAKIDSQKCLSCGECVAYCPFGLIEIIGFGEKAQVNDGCTLCGDCQEACPYGALTFDDKPE